MNNPLRDHVTGAIERGEAVPIVEVPTAEALRARSLENIEDCTCVEYCDEDPRTACSLSGIPHVHPDNGSGTFGPCPVHPDRPGDH